ncbi:8-oxo-dGTP diphosphatase [Alkalibacillus filiformis]|uniref:8-oxo-dGTP diphosphatase n=1 Tax=Alkalibacillus filiformis TaxID=200990 RepID=A0ABU0DXA8_9BACI|nr:nucleoside triphosphatase YtkD [Alkalibacillus filiformis]MDQ0352944.1 8-oxo-dGTP diphosphatase [Alkalibacillus filiformis]
MEVFKDYYQNTVKFVKNEMYFSNQPKHVWVITKHKGQWLLTKHKNRGIEFPGGKVEQGESADQAAIREVYEETGGIVKELQFVGQYYVDGKGGDIVKNVYFAQIDELEERPHYYETEGPILLDDIPKNVKKDHRYSFMMKDKVLQIAIKEIKSL